MRGVSALLWACGAVAALLTWQLFVPAMAPFAVASSMAVRLGTAAALLLPGAFVLAAMILAQMLGRVASGAADPLAGRDSRFLLVNQRVIDNTVEQFVVFVPGFLALAAGVPSAHAAEAFAAGPVFAVARLAFWGGYLHSAIGRAPGMVATYATNVTTLLAAAWFWLQ